LKERGGLPLFLTMMEIDLEQLWFIEKTLYDASQFQYFSAPLFLCVFIRRRV
jgi:hypothetical protein